MSDHAAVIRRLVLHIARGCRASTAHNPAPYEIAISAALDALVAEGDALRSALNDMGLEASVCCSCDAVMQSVRPGKAQCLGCERAEAAEKSREEYIEETIRLRDALFAAEARVTELEAALNPDVIEERRRQDQVWGQQEHDDPLWLAILTEEVGEAAEGVLHEIFGGSAVTRREVVQVAAVALAWIECIDRRAALAKEDTDE